MSEEKLYAVKNDEGKYWDFSVKVNGFLSFSNVDVPVTIDKDLASEVARNSDGHVVTLIEEPEKVVLSKEQAEIVEHARDSNYPADCVSAYSGFGASGEQKLLIEAYVNGYTVAKKKRYLLPMEGFGEHQGYSYMEDGIWYINTAPTQDYAVKHGYTVTKDEYDSAPNWVKVLKPVEVTDDEQ